MWHCACLFKAMRVVITLILKKIAATKLFNSNFFLLKICRVSRTKFVFRNQKNLFLNSTLFLQTGGWKAATKLKWGNSFIIHQVPRRASRKAANKMASFYVCLGDSNHFRFREPFCSFAGKCRKCWPSFHADFWQLRQWKAAKHCAPIASGCPHKLGVNVLSPDCWEEHELFNMEYIYYIYWAYDRWLEKLANLLLSKLKPRNRLLLITQQASFLLLSGTLISSKRINQSSSFPTKRREKIIRKASRVN